MSLFDVDFESFRFATRGYLVLLAVPALLAVLWLWRFLRYRAEVRRFRAAQGARAHPRFAAVGELAFWFCAIVASTLCILALARPQGSVKSATPAGVDLVVLLDGSASMYALDIPPSRWQRSLQFVRAVAEGLSWKGDRMALALFAYRASPQVRLTRDPNALFFFLDHLGETSPFSLDDATTWDTNIEEGIHWGLRLIETDESLFGRRRNAKAFVVISDGQAWSGEVDRALKAARELRIPVHVIGIGTTTGALLPEPERFAAIEKVKQPRIRARLDRENLLRIAREGGGDYYEIGREPDRDLTFRLIQSVRRRASASDEQVTHEELYWRFLAAAAIATAVGVLFLSRRVHLWWTAAGGTAALLALLALIY
ncbi:MAG: vWA domain-containing protein [Gammaproteobacteria bacterium]